MTKIGIIREGKNPPDKRVPLTPKQCADVVEQYSGVEVVVQPSPVRAFPDGDYTDAGIALQDDLSDCDIIMGVKEVPVDMLIPGKTFMFFSHTFKQQPYNRNLLRAILDKHISLVDYEVLTAEKGQRLIGFGRYAGIVGCYNAFLAYGRKSGRYTLKPAHKCFDRSEVEQELKRVDLPKNFKLVLTGSGRVGGGALEMLEHVAIAKVDPEQYLKAQFEGPVYTQLSVQDYVAKNDGSDFENSEFYEFPERFVSNFMRFARVSEMYIPCHYWDHRAPFIFTREDAKQPDFRIKVVADISCDIDGPVASTIRPSTIADPLYGYLPATEKEVDFDHPEAIGVMAIDNLPCELPRDASEDFGNELIKNIFPELLGKERSAVIERARQTDLHGKLTERYAYLEGYVKGT
jgi:hypothetical protein